MGIVVAGPKSASGERQLLLRRIGPNRKPHRTGGIDAARLRWARTGLTCAATSTCR